MASSNSRSPGATYRFGHFALNLDHGALLAADGSEVTLRPKSFAVLRLLVENAGRLLDRDTIMAAVWPGIYVTDESLAQCIKDVRRGLGDEGPRMVRTLPKRGYRFEAEVVVDDGHTASSGTMSSHLSDDIGQDQEPPPAPWAVVAILDRSEPNRAAAVGRGHTPRWLNVIDAWVTTQNGRMVARADHRSVIALPDLQLAVKGALDLLAETSALSTDHDPPPPRVAIHAARMAGRPNSDLADGEAMIAMLLAEQGEPGSLTVTAEVMHTVDGQIAASSIDLGRRFLPNMAGPVQVYQISPPGRTPPRDPLVRPDPRPSIAVLPFRRDLISADQAYLADGITEGIIHVLAGLEALFVISRASTLGFRDTVLDPRAIGREFGVRYILHGSMWRSADRLRLGVELTDTETGAVVLTRFHDGEMADLFQLQDRISIEVAASIAPHVQRRELQRALRKHPGNMTAYDLVLQALDQIHRLRRESFEQGYLLLLQAIAEDPGYATAYSYAAWWHILSIAQGWSADQEADSTEAARLSLAATERDQNDALALAVRGYVTAYGFRDYGTALQLLDRALLASPNCALACLFSSIVHSWLGDGPNAVLQAERGRRLSPLDPLAFLHENFLAMAYYINRDYDTAVFWARSSAARNPRHAPTLRGLAASLAAAGQVAEASEIASRLLEIEPGFRLGLFVLRTPLKGDIRDQYVDRLRQAGLPD